MSVAVHRSLSAALGLDGPEVVALVGGGGKSSALRLLAEEWAAAGHRVLATTTTAMFTPQLRAVGPLLVDTDVQAQRRDLERLLAEGSPVALASAYDADNKVVGLAPSDVDRLWAAGLAERVVVEADGARGRSLKAFAAHEPQVPARATTVVLMAGVDVAGKELRDLWVHRADAVATLTCRRAGSPVTPRLVADVLRAQVVRLRQSCTARLVLLLNKADGPRDVAVGYQIADALCGPRTVEIRASGRRRGRAADDPDASPDLTVVGSVRRRRFFTLASARTPVVGAASTAVAGPADATPALTTKSPRAAADRSSGRSVAAVVLAAGRASRMGSQKLLLPVGARPMVRRVVDAALASRACRTVVVVGHDATSVGAAIGDRPVMLVRNEDHLAGMSTSLRAGLAAVGADCDGVLFLLGDQPFVTPELLDALIDRFCSTGSPVVRPVVDGRPANPVLIGASLFPEIRELRGDVGAREIVARHGAHVCLVPIADPLAVMDVDTLEDYRAIRGCA